MARGKRGKCHCKGKKRGGSRVAKRVGTGAKKVAKRVGLGLGTAALLSLANPDVRSLVRASYNLNRNVNRRQRMSNTRGIEMVNLAR